MGYFRSPSLQAPNQIGCPSLDQARNAANPDDRASNAAAVTLRRVSNIPDGAILLGTGDNFSPQLEARTFNPAPAPASSGAPANRLPPAQKELYAWHREQTRWVHYEQIRNIPPLHARLLTGTNSIPSDNVACYLAAAGYTAVVPGKHDFYFGPERLRQLARFMANENENGLKPVQMLGANLVIKTSLISPKEVAEDAKKWAWPEKLSVLNIGDGNEVYPWLSHARVKLVEFTPNNEILVRLREILRREVFTETELRDAVNQIGIPTVPADAAKLKDLFDNLNNLSTQDVYVCPAGKDRNDIKVDASCRLDPAERTFRVVDDSVVEDFGFKLPRDDDHLVLEPGKNHGLVLQARGAVKTCADENVSCIRFRTRLPLFHFSDSAGDESHFPKRYVYREKDNVVIFGVIDPTLGQQVGVLNFSWNNVNKDNSTVVGVEDPVEALQTQLDFFNRTHPKFDGVKILLAQMGPERARALGARFPEFQIVVTAADKERSTSELDFRMRWAEGPQAKAFLAVPGPYSDPEQRDRYEGIVHLGRIKVSYEPNFQQEKYVRTTKKPAAWILESNRIDPEEVRIIKPVYARATGADRTGIEEAGFALPESNESQSLPFNSPVKMALANYTSPPLVLPTSFFGSIKKRFDKCEANNTVDNFSKIQLLTLCVMRERVKADAALIQKRDFSNELPDVDITNPAHFQQALDRIISKNDLLSLLYVPGSALKNALEQSKKFDNEDANALSLAEERGRGLQFTGVFFDTKSKKYIINEVPLDDKKIYVIATTVYVGAGDTGYPDLASAALNPKNRVDKFPPQLVPISSLVCRELFDKPEDSWPYCLADLQTTMYLNETNATVDPAGEPLSFGSKVANFFMPTDRTWTNPLSLNDRIQRRPIWVLSLRNLGLTFISLSHNLSDDDVSKKFGGVPTSGVTANKTYTFATNMETRFSRSSHSYEFFIGSKVDYKEQSTGDKNPKVDQLSNRITPEVGIVRNIWGGRGRSRLGATVTFHTEVPLAKPFTVFKLNNNEQLKITQSRSVLILPRIGLRWQSDTNYLELGGQVGREYKALGGYRFNTTSEVCLPNAAETFGACITRLNSTTPPSVTKDTAASPILERRNRAGLYWKSGLTIPLGSIVKYELTDEGNFFFNFHRDNVTDTRVWDSQKHSIKFAIFSSLSIGPSLQMIFFKNKINRDFLFQKQFGIETSFAFDLFNRREKGVQVKHKP